MVGAEGVDGSLSKGAQDRLVEILLEARAFIDHLGCLPRLEICKLMA